MGFPYAVIRMPKPITITVLSNLLHHIKFMTMVVLTRLGLLNPPERDNSIEQHPAVYILAMDRLSPSLVPVPIHICTASIKKRLPVVEYSDLLERFGILEDKDTACAVCLNGFERSHEIRELSNCSHVFHRECLDGWVDEGQLTCPLCRSMLFPAKEEMTRCGGGDPWMMERNAYLFGEDYGMATS